VGPVYRLVKKIPRGRVNNLWRSGKALRSPLERVPWATRWPHAQRARHSLASRARSRRKIRVPEPHAALQRKLLETEGVTME